MILELLQIVIPILIMTVIGYLSIALGLLPKSTGKTFSTFILTFSLPALLFADIIQEKRQFPFDIKFILSCILCFILIFILSFLVDYIVFKRDKAKSTLEGMLATWPNCFYIGIPVLYYLFGKPIFILLVLVGMSLRLLIGPIVIFLFESNSHNSESSLFKKLVHSICRSIFEPFIIASVIAYCFVYYNVTLPKIIMMPLHYLGETTIGLAFLVTGMTLYGHKMNLNIDIIKNVFIKLLISPLVGIGLLLLLGIKGPFAIAFILILCLPSANICLFLAHRYKVYEETTAASILISTLCFVFSMALWYPVANLFLR